MSGEGEFEFIKRRLAPLSRGAPGAAGLRDDGALIDFDPGETLVVTSDTLIEGRHFPVGEDAGLAARKALRVNLSDLAAMGARPFGYLLNIAWPQGGPGDRGERLAAGLKGDQSRFGVCLLGGDTTVTSGPWTLSITAMGRRPAGLGLRRSGARAGDTLVATGAIGDAALGLKAQLGEALNLDPEDMRYLSRRCSLPSPRMETLAAVRRHANAVIDVSDGVLADARHLADESGLSLDLALDRLPLSRAAASWLAGLDDEASGLLELACGGDDYELLIATSRPEALISELEQAGLSAVAIGGFSAGPPGVEVRCRGVRLAPGNWGFTHF